MHPYLSEMIARQRQADLCARAARSRHASQARHAQQAQEARQARQARQAWARRGHRHLIRRRVGWALVSLGLRLAYAAGEG
jgi:hypothetical protein